MTATRKTGAVDNPSAAGVTDLLTTDLSQLPGVSAQAVDIFPTGDDFSMKTVSGSVTIALTSSTVPLLDVAAFQVPAGQFMLVDRMTIMRYAASQIYGRIATRYLLAGNCAQASPAAGAAPTVAAVALGFTSGLGTGSRSYKYTQVNALNQESAASTVSATVTPTATQGINITLPALATGAVAIRIYRCLSGSPAGPWYWLDDAIAGVYTDQVADSFLTGVRGSTVIPSVTWGNAFTPSGNTPAGPVEMVFENVGVALTAAPAQIFYVSGKGIPSAVAFAPALTANTRVRIPPSGEGRGFAVGPAGFQLQNPQIADYGAMSIVGFDKTYAAIGGQWVVWGYAAADSPAHETTAVAGGRNMSKYWKPLLFSSGDTIVGQVGSSAAAVATVIEIEINGRLFTNPT